MVSPRGPAFEEARSLRWPASPSWPRRELSLPLAPGLGLALVQIGVFDLVRFTLTGTGNGFTL